MSTLNAAALLTLTAALAACSAKTPTAPAAAAGPAGAAAASQSLALGGRLYDGNCVPCHQQNGVGIPGVYPSLVGSPVVLGDPAELARWVVKGQRPPSMPVGRYSTQMLQFGWMQPADAAALFSYLRSNFGNSAAPVDAATVARALAQ
jgi:alcohol dehydrogenase (quinone), cytochrome c subunit